jgi:hypothetical protein
MNNINIRHNLIGKSFGDLKVIRFLDATTKQKSRLWECKCICGNIIIKSSNSLKASDTKKHCGCKKAPPKKLGPYIDLIGKKFNRLVVIKCAGFTRSNSMYRWLCQCDCGKKIIVRGAHLKNGNTKSCGCLKEEKAQEYDRTDGVLLRRLFRLYLINANRRKISFNLSYKDFKKIVYSKCHYCKIIPSKKYTRKDRNYIKYILYNGVDRKDNIIGYTKKNSVPCCEICNRAKSTLPYKDFLTYINRIKNI